MEGLIVLTMLISVTSFYIVILIFNYKKMKRNIKDWSPKIGEALIEAYPVVPGSSIFSGSRI
jgi:hypothetical protein